jgi:DNA repair photolyase
VDVVRLSDRALPFHREDLVLRTRKGRWIRPFRGSEAAFFLAAIQGCPWRCAYCFLQGYLEEAATTLFTNTADLEEEIHRFLHGGSARGARLHAAHLGEIVPWEDWTGLCGWLVDRFRDSPETRLELRTKTDRCDDLLACEPPPHVVLSWTLSPASFAKRMERGAPGPSGRIEAARKAASAGASVGIRLDPVVLEPGWEEAYVSLAEDLGRAFSGLPLESVEIGTFRCAKKVAEAIRIGGARGLLSGELLPGPDGKIRYLWPLRVKAYRWIARSLRSSLGDKVDLRLCMEPPWIAERALG